MPGPDYFKDIRRPKKADWKKHERDVEARTGDRRNRSSGAGHGKTGQSAQWRRGSVSPGDNIGKRLRECKATRGSTLKVAYKWLHQLVEQSLCMIRQPVLELRMEGAVAPLPTDWVMVPANNYDELLEKAQATRLPFRTANSSKGQKSFTLKDEWLLTAVEQTDHEQAIEIYLPHAVLPVSSRWIIAPAEAYDALEERAGA